MSNPEIDTRSDKIQEIREELGFDEGIESRSSERLHYDELSTILGELTEE